MSPAGDVQIGLMDKKGQLEVEVIRARGLTPKPGSKSLPGTTQALLLNFTRVWLLLFNLSPLPSFLPAPAPYVKVYLLDNGTCKAKKKTKIARKTLEPLYQQHLLFDESPQGKVLQVSVRDTTPSLLKPRLACLHCCSMISLTGGFLHPLGDSVGRLWPIGPQMFYGCSTDSIRGAGPL